MSMLLPHRYTIERWSYTLQRVSGVAVSFYFILHILETGYIVGGPGVWGVPPYEFAKESWEATLAQLSNPIFDTGLSIIGFLVALHSINGIRLTLAHFGLGLGRPGRPTFPHQPQSFSNLQRAVFWVSIAFAVFALIYSLDALLGVFRP